MLSYFLDNPEVMFGLAAFVGAFGLSLLFPVGRARGLGARPKGASGGRVGAAFYVRIDYRFPPHSRRTLAKVFGNSPDVRALYLRSEFLLSTAIGLRPDQILHKWAVSPTWAEERAYFAQNRRDAQAATISMVRRGDTRRVYSAPKASPEKPLALNFPLLPQEFAMFVGTRFSVVDDGAPRMVEQGMYVCRIEGWREDDGYAPVIECDDMGGNRLMLEQSDVIEALRTQKAALEGVYFAGLPLYRFVSKSSSVAVLAAEQKLGHKIALRLPSPRDFLALDAKLLKLMGGVNPINLVRLSRFYHPVTGVKPDEQKYKKLVGKARDSGLAQLKTNKRQYSLTSTKNHRR